MSENVLAVDGLQKRFGSLQALQGMTLEMRGGEVFGFVGSNGAGKTTTMRIMLGVLLPDAGAVSWNGVPVGPDIRRRIGYMPEERGLYPKMRVQEQLEYFAQAHGLSSAIARINAQRWIERLQITDYARTELQKLSLGNQQRVQLAAALIHDPIALVLDEPFSGLDPLAVDVMSEVLREQAASGVAVLFSSHQLDLVERLCQRVGVVAKGRMVANGTVDELRSTGPALIDIEVDAPSEAWLETLTGVSITERNGRRLALTNSQQVDDRALLQAALNAGTVTYFAHRRRSLSDLFRSVVDEKETNEV